MTAAAKRACHMPEDGRVFVGVFEIKREDGLFVVYDPQTARPADVPPFTIADEAIVWCAKNSAKARRL